MRDLADTTGMNTPSLYNAFDDKKAIYRLVLDRYVRLAHEACSAILGGDDPPLLPARPSPPLPRRDLGAMLGIRALARTRSERDLLIGVVRPPFAPLRTVKKVERRALWRWAISYPAALERVGTTKLQVWVISSSPFGCTLAAYEKSARRKRPACLGCGARGVQTERWRAGVAIQINLWARSNRTKLSLT
jgi:AcrR family transcriptional regulator